MALYFLILENQFLILRIDFLILINDFLLLINEFLLYENDFLILKGLAHAKIIKKSVILFRVFNMTI